MSKVIVVCGRSGVGKTTLARALSRKMSIFCIHKDEMKEPLYELLGGKSLEDSNNIGRYSMELLFRLAENAIKTGIDVIVEAPFWHPSNPNIFVHWKKNLNADVRIIICSLIDDSERVRRKQERERHHSHHDNDRFPEIGSPDYSPMPDPKLVLDMSAPPAELVEKSLAFIE